MEARNSFFRWEEPSLKVKASSQFRRREPTAEATNPNPGRGVERGQREAGRGVQSDGGCRPEVIEYGSRNAEESA